MKFGVMAAGAGLAMMMSVAATEAAPIGAATFQPAVSTGEAQILLVRGGCGWGAHRTWSGYCRLNYGWRGGVRRWGWRRW